MLWDADLKVLQSLLSLEKMLLLDEERAQQTPIYIDSDYLQLKQPFLDTETSLTCCWNR